MKKIGFIGGKFLPLHLGHVYAITQAACMCEELYVVLTYSRVRDRRICEASGFSEILPEVRLRWLSQMAKDMENVKVVGIEDFSEDTESYQWEEGAEQIRAVIGEPITCVFSSEREYEAIFARLYPEAEHIILDASRERYPVSGTMIREEGVFAHWEELPGFVRAHYVKKVVIVGTESCGKSTLARYLAKLYNTVYTEEYGRLACEELGGCSGILTRELFPYIAYGHKMLEYEAFQKANKVAFIDTEAIVTQYYSGIYTGQSHPVLKAVAAMQDYDLWLYLEPDVPWVDDGLRVHGWEQVRRENDQKLKEMLKEQGVKYVSISGSYIQRLHQAISCVDALLRK